MSEEPKPKRSKPNDKWTAYDPPWIEEDGIVPFRYRVESKENPDLWYIVDLTARGGHGRCSCVNFQMVAEPNFKRHGNHIPYEPGRHGCSECKHIAAAFAHYHQYVTIPMLASLKNGIPSR